MEEPRVMFIDIPSVPSKSRSVSPMSPSPSRERNLNFFEMISRRFGRRSQDDLCYQHTGEEDSRSSSTDSCSSTSGRCIIASKNIHNSNLELNCSSSNSDSSSTTGSNGSVESNADGNVIQRMHRRSTSSLRKALKNFTISPRSLSCSSTPSKEHKTPKKSSKQSPPPKRILRQPVSYTYLKGMSGLPTQRVPRSSVCLHYYSHR